MHLLLNSINVLCTINKLRSSNIREHVAFLHADINQLLRITDIPTYSNTWLVIIVIDIHSMDGVPSIIRAHGPTQHTHTDPDTTPLSWRQSCCLRDQSIRPGVMNLMTSFVRTS